MADGGAGYSLQTANTRELKTENPFANAFANSFGAFNVGRGSASGGSSADAKATASNVSIPTWVWIAGMALAAIFVIAKVRRHHG